MKKTLFLLPVLIGTLTGCNNGPSTIEFDYIFTAQPVVFATSSKGYDVYKNVQNDFTAKAGGQRIIQASVFINKNTDVNKASLFLESLKKDIADGVNNPTLIRDGIAKAGTSPEAQQAKYGVAAGAAFNVTKSSNGFSLDFEYTSEIKSEVSNFVSIINPSITSIDDSYFFEKDITDDEADFSTFKIVCPTGAPAVAFYNYALNENFETAAPIPQFLTNKYDVIVAPTHGGMDKLINANANYQIAATITFGNMYILSTGRDADNIMNKGDKVLYFSQTDLPGKVFNYLYGSLELDAYAVPSAADTKSIIENNGTMKL